MLPWWWLVLLLLLQELLDDLGSGQLLGQRLVWFLWGWEELRTLFIEAFLYDRHSECLMNSDATRPTLMSTSMGRPSV